jgi:hypothetical protein
VGNGCAVRAFGSRPLDVDVDPLTVPRRVGEGVNTVLIDSGPSGYTEFLTDGVNGLSDGCDDAHRAPLS